MKYETQGYEYNFHLSSDASEKRVMSDLEAAKLNEQRRRRRQRGSWLRFCEPPVRGKKKGGCSINTSSGGNIGAPPDTTI